MKNLYIYAENDMMAAFVEALVDKSQYVNIKKNIYPHICQLSSLFHMQTHLIKTKDLINDSKIIVAFNSAGDLNNVEKMVGLFKDTACGIELGTICFHPNFISIFDNDLMKMFDYIKEGKLSDDKYKIFRENI